MKKIIHTIEETATIPKPAFQLVLPTICLRGNWDDDLIQAFDGSHSYDDETKIMISRIGEFIGNKVGVDSIQEMAKWPITTSIQVGVLHLILNHNLPQNNSGQGLFPTNEQQQMDQIMGPTQCCDVGIYAHVHHQLYRYTSKERLILNPGSVGEPYDGWNIHQTNLRARYLLLTIDDEGIADLDYRRVTWNVQEERDRALNEELPYKEMYLRHLENGRNFIHDQPFLAQINHDHNYLQEVINYSKSRKH
ncbi:MAG: metallophosphoesterase [Limosilactobacillus sp.]|jgi:predicted phosphodiesterase|uniref:metallophosphoesterase family protein n=1 Tax=Limosilactobacillus sp. TaxID=2773925 RepID=UPI0025C4FCFF|nr:metallophosphoesterase [Limosilactobacillus sp.]MCI1974874.1 metallophosphoesterase [Limosilactobacillus sp.]MCI2031085.1 metallophosphoesterase [Limosilactobacillus sp.]